MEVNHNDPVIVYAFIEGSGVLIRWIDSTGKSVSEETIVYASKSNVVVNSSSVIVKYANS